MRRNYHPMEMKGNLLLPAGEMPTLSRKKGFGMNNSKSIMGKMLLEIFDALFIMLLCFATLFSAMLMKGDSLHGMRYSINALTLGITLIGLSIYFAFVLSQSDKGLKALIHRIYKNKSSTIVEQD